MGKDSAAKFLHSHLKLEHGKLKVKTIGFATRLKAICHELYGWVGVKNQQHYEDHPEDRNVIIPYLGYDVVRLWINVGDKMREIDPYVWVHPVTKADHNCDVLIVTDVRYKSEIDAVREAGGWLYKVHNPRTPYRDSPADRDLENYMGWDKLILNDGTLSDLNDEIEWIARRYEQEKM